MGVVSTTDRVTLIAPCPADRIVSSTLLPEEALGPQTDTSKSEFTRISCGSGSAHF
jgi:hypothetical protein